MADTANLQFKGNQYRVVKGVPRDLWPIAGRKFLVQYLGTDSLTKAQQLRAAVLREFDALIAMWRGDAPTKDMEMGLALRLALAARQPNADHQALALETAIAADSIPPGAKREAFTQIASGRTTPIDEHLNAHLEMSDVGTWTKQITTRAVAALADWCKKENIAPVIQSFDKRTCVRFAEQLPVQFEGRDPTTLQHFVNRLARYWKWLEDRGDAPSNPWRGVKVPTKRKTFEDKERPFTDDEMRKLLTGDPKREMNDLMRIAALSGARIEAIVELHKDDIVVAHGIHCFKFKPMKKEEQPRLVPVHSQLREIVATRLMRNDVGATNLLFPEWPAVTWRRATLASNQFTRYRRDVGVDNIVNGSRRSKANFHSFRRWFITEAERAGINGDIIAAVVGHKRKGMTLGLYSAGPALRQAQECVEAVRLPLPKKANLPTWEGRE